jgi:hypothetical protein
MVADARMTGMHSDGSYRQEFYPDLDPDGLAVTLAEIVRSRGLAIGTMEPAAPGVNITTSRGSVFISLAAKERQFLVSIRHSPGFGWAHGSTADLGMLADMVAAWHDGISLDEFEARFEFMQLDEFARAIESETVTELQWSKVLTSDMYVWQRPVLEAARDDEVLGGLFPTVSHGTIRLRSDLYGTGVVGHLLIDRLEEDVYRITVVGASEPPFIATSMADAINFARNRSDRRGAASAPD